jgi:hypothetical protein
MSTPAGRLAAYYDQSIPPDLLEGDDEVPGGLDPDITQEDDEVYTASPDDVFEGPNFVTVTAEDAPNAAKLDPLGFVADPLTAWVEDEAILVNGFAFSWDGDSWVAGPAPA